MNLCSSQNMKRKEDCRAAKLKREENKRENRVQKMKHEMKIACSGSRAGDGNDEKIATAGEQGSLY